MTAAIETTRPTDGTESPRRPRRRRGWALLAPAAALLGVGGMMNAAVGFTRSQRRADADLVARAIADAKSSVPVGAAVGLVAVACLVVFVAGLRRHLAAQAPEGSLVPAVAWAGGLLAAAGLVVSFGFSFTMANVSDQAYRATTMEMFQAITDSAAFQAWAPLALTVAAVAWAGIRQGAVARWLGWFSATMAVALAVPTLIGLPFATWLPSAIWLLVAGPALWLSDRSPA